MTEKTLIGDGVSALLDHAGTKTAVANEITALREHYKKLAEQGARQTAEMEHRLKALIESTDGALVMVAKFDKLLAELSA